MKVFTITLEGKGEGDIEAAAAEVLRLIRTGCTSGFNENDSGAFAFDSTGEYDDE